ncbi:hypothetical protein CRUP_012122 [Coryphaenoides rupestris]|nr:hypothetical protein CRUP_012122 [Coryphaenoides rupestris]
MLDTRVQLNDATGNQVPRLALSAAQLAGHMTLRLVHDHLLRFDLRQYDLDIRSYVYQFNRNLRVIQKRQPNLLPKSLIPRWLISASGSFSLATDQFLIDIDNSQLNDVGLCREVNDRLMQVERNLLSPYVSLRDSPFRHVVVGSGTQTLQALLDHLDAFRMGGTDSDPDAFQNQLALATWTIQGCANSLAGPIWSLDNEI